MPLESAKQHLNEVNIRIDFAVKIRLMQIEDLLKAKHELVEASVVCQVNRDIEGMEDAIDRAEEVLESVS